MADKYTFGDIIGHGNYGTCFLVTHVSENRLYVAKRVPVIDVAARGEALAEAQLLSKIKHPNVIAYKESFLSTDDAGGDGDGDDDYGRNGNNRKKQKQKTRYGGDPATLCIVTAYAEEGDLFTHIKRARESRPRRYFPERQVLDWTAQIALALDHIHGMRVMHRDLKTQNIFLGRGGVVKLGDFGISRVLERTDDFATTVAGTPYYLSPEVCQNMPYTLKSDVWSFGCVIFEICSLRHAFAADSLLSLVYQIVNGTCDFSLIAERYDKRLVSLIEKMLNRDANLRPSAKQALRQPVMQEHLRKMQVDGLGRPRSAAAVISQQVPKEALSRRVLQGNSGSLVPFQEDLNPTGNQSDDQLHQTPREAAATRRRQEAEARERVLKLAANAQENVSKKGFAKEFHGRHVESNTSRGNSTSETTSQPSSNDPSRQHTRDNSADLEASDYRANDKHASSHGWEDEVAEYALMSGTDMGGTGMSSSFGGLMTQGDSFLNTDTRDASLLREAVDSLEGLGLSGDTRTRDAQRSSRSNELGFVPPPFQTNDNGTFFGSSAEACFSPPTGGVVGSGLGNGQPRSRYDTYDSSSVEFERSAEHRAMRGSENTSDESFDDSIPDASWLNSTLPNAPLSPAQNKMEAEILAALTLDAEADVRAEEEVFLVTEFAAKHFHDQESPGYAQTFTGKDTYDYDDAPRIRKDTEGERAVLLAAAKSLDEDEAAEIRAAAAEVRDDAATKKTFSVQKKQDPPPRSKSNPRAPDSPQSSPLPTPPADDSVVAARAHKVSRLRQMCGAQLGEVFAEVHGFLRSARRRHASDSEVKTKLLTLVNNDAAKLAACFAVDMLCFEEEFLFTELEQVKPAGTYSPGVNVFVTDSSSGGSNRGSNDSTIALHEKLSRSSSSNGGGSSSNGSPRNHTSPTATALPGGRVSAIAKLVERERSKKRSMLPGA